MTVIKTLAVIGAGQMGGGIAQTAVVIAKIPSVFLFDLNRDALESRRTQISIHKLHSSYLIILASLLTKNINQGKLSEVDKNEALQRLNLVTDLKSLQDCDFVIEAVPEIEDLKASIFKQLSSILVKDSVIVASNTSSISITKLATTYREPNKFIGMHFMNPVPIMKLVELISGKQTSIETLNATKSLAEQMGKTSTCSNDIPGFIVNRMLMPYINEAIFALYEGVATKEDIDKSMVLGTNVPMGPLKLADFVGLDTCLFIMKVLHAEFGDSKYRPCPLLVQMVNAGYFGKKNGKGFYEYNS